MAAFALPQSQRGIASVVRSREKHKTKKRWKNSRGHLQGKANEHRPERRPAPGCRRVLPSCTAESLHVRRHLPVAPTVGALPLLGVAHV